MILQAVSNDLGEVMSGVAFTGGSSVHAEITQIKHERIYEEEHISISPSFT